MSPLSFFLVQSNVLFLVRLANSQRNAPSTSSSQHGVYPKSFAQQFLFSLWVEVVVEEYLHRFGRKLILVGLSYHLLILYVS